MQAAAVPLRGPGVTLTLDDAATAGGDANAGSRPSSGFQEGRVTSGDLQVVVNGLWGAGAEAISINGHRLSSTAAIRFAGQAIIVDFRPLARPYVITALGDPQAMQQLFEPSFAGLYLSQLTDQYKIRSTMAAGDSLTVPGDPSARLEVARPLGSSPPSAPGGSSTGMPSQPPSSSNSSNGNPSNGNPSTGNPTTPTTERNHS